MSKENSQHQPSGADNQVGGSINAANAANAYAGADELVDRPSGAGPIYLGWIMIIAGAAAIAAGLFASETQTSYGASGSFPEPAPWKWPAIYGGAGLLQLGLVFWGVGSIVRAIFFVPGRTIRHRDL